jgi:hypothetical protein
MKAQTDLPSRARRYLPLSVLLVAFVLALAACGRGSQPGADFGSHDGADCNAGAAGHAQPDRDALADAHRHTDSNSDADLTAEHPVPARAGVSRQ